MKRVSPFRLLLVSIAMLTFTTQCGTTSSLLSSGSSLISSLAKNVDLSTISSLLQTPGLDKLLGGVLEKPFTLLAPTNNAFSALGEEAISNLTNPANIGQLADVLKNHIVPEKLDAAGVMAEGLNTAGGKALDLGGINLGDMIGDEKFNIFPIDKVLP